MTTNPAHEVQPRDPHGRFGPVPLSAVELDLVPPAGSTADPVPGFGGAWPTADTDPAEAQAMLHEIAWDSSRHDTERTLAARGAIACSRELNDGVLDSIPPGDEAEGYIDQAVTDNDFVLDAVHEVGPLPYPASRAFGSELAGQLYDSWTDRRDELIATHERFLVDQVLPPESDASLRDADIGRTEAQPPFEWCRTCGGHGWVQWPDPSTGEPFQDHCADCESTGREHLTPVAGH